MFRLANRDETEGDESNRGFSSYLSLHLREHPAQRTDGSRYLYEAKPPALRARRLTGE